MTSHINPLLLRLHLLKYLKGGTALDIGAGTGKDSTFLLESGYTVTAIDIDDSKIPKNTSIKDIKFIKNDITQISMDLGEFDLILAYNILPFVSKDKVKKVINDLINSLKKDGLFCFTIFGKDDAWASKENMNFMTYKGILMEIRQNPVEIIFQSTEKGLGTTMKGEEKFWEIHKFIVRKK